MRRAAALALLLAAPWAAASAPIAPFSSAAPGAALPGGWVARAVPGVPPAAIALVRDAGATVLEVRTRASAGAASHALRADPAATPILAWRWKVDRVVAAADLARRDGDDFAARVYVFFDLPDDELPLGERIALGLARLLHGESLPAAGLCYVWDNRHPPGTSGWNPYASRIRTVVVESGAGEVARWRPARRDVAADFRAAFGARAVPAIVGIAAGADTDQTGEAATAWFGDFRLEARP